MSNSAWWNKLLGPFAIDRAKFAVSQGLPGQGFYLSIPDEDGWTSFSECGPPQGVLLQFRYNHGDGQYTSMSPGYAEKLSPYFDRAGMQWRITGIGKEQLAAYGHLKKPLEDGHAYRT